MGWTAPLYYALVLEVVDRPRLLAVDLGLPEWLIEEGGPVPRAGERLDGGPPRIRPFSEISDDGSRFRGPSMRITR